MASVKKQNNSVVIAYDGKTFSFPMNVLVITADDLSETVNFKLMSDNRTLFSVNYKEFTSPTGSISSEDCVKKILNIINGL